jgi:phenylacetate-coenzyme A ligase PaaK-like adenylate-forming protein
MQVRLGLRVEVIAVPAGSLPRFEGKGRRIVDRRDARRNEGRNEGREEG